MEIEELKKRATPFKPYNVVMLLVVAIVIITSYIGVDMSIK